MDGDIRAQLNAVYRPLHDEATAALRIIRGMGYTARLTYCNLHETMVDGAYQTEYFPLPEIEIEGAALCADFGIALDKTAWLEFTLTRERALALDYEHVAAAFEFEAYGAENYLTDLYRKGMRAAELRGAMEKTNEREFHLLFSLARAEEQAIEGLFTRLSEEGILQKIV
ncbi:MAG: hypothetical protein ABFC62_05285 [Clostridiaceae bacterium]|nr:hypothetical protein [Eubacteriales bacterium]